MTIVDDHSRSTWVFLLRNKHEVLTVFPNFIHQVENKYNTTVKSVRSDNAPELRFTQFYRDKGITPYHSCPETPEQNSVVEMKHQHILNVARALMFQSGVPLSLWGDYVLTAVFLINRTPSQLLSNKSPYQVLTSTDPDYTQLKTFGCLCYGSTSAKQRHKFLPRARACLFLGYPYGYKGYKLMDLESNVVFISRNVVFHEEVFPLLKKVSADIPQNVFTPTDPELSPAIPSQTSSSPTSHVLPPSSLPSTAQRNHLHIFKIITVIL